MGIRKRKVSSLPVATTLVNLIVLGVDGSTKSSAKVPIELLKGNIGKTPVLNVEVSAIEYGSTPTVVKEGTDENAVFKIGFPKSKDGRIPLFRKGPTGIEFKYEGQTDQEYQSLIGYDVLKMSLSDLSPEDIAQLQQPALEAAIIADQAANRANQAAQAVENLDVSQLVAQINAMQTDVDALKIEGVVQKDTYLLFPTIGNERTLYIDKQTSTAYRWDDAELKFYSLNSSDFEVINGGE